MTWDPTIRADTLIAATGIMAVILGAYVRIRERLISIENTLSEDGAIQTKLTVLWREYEDRRSGDDRRYHYRRQPGQNDTGE